MKKNQELKVRARHERKHSGAKAAMIKKCQRGTKAALRSVRRTLAKGKIA